MEAADTSRHAISVRLFPGFTCSRWAAGQSWPSHISWVFGRPFTLTNYSDVASVALLDVLQYAANNPPPHPTPTPIHPERAHVIAHTDWVGAAAMSLQVCHRRTSATLTLARARCKYTAFLTCTYFTPYFKGYILCLGVTSTCAREENHC